MDPLSISASIIALIGAADAASTGIKKLIRLRGAPDIILALNNDMSDLQLLLNEVDNLLAEARNADGPGNAFNPLVGVRSLPPILERLHAKLADLNRFLRRVPPEGLSISNKLLWLRIEPGVIKIRSELYHLKQNLNTALSLLTSSTALRVHVELQGLRLTAANESSSSARTLSDSDVSSDEAVTVIPDCRSSAERAIKDVEQQLHWLSIMDHEKQTTPSQAGQEVVSSLGPAHPTEPVSAGSAFGALQMRFMQRRRCQAWCRCACHSEGRSNLPRFLAGLMGMLYVGYAGIPALSPPCDSTVCEGNSEGLLQVQYLFPTWFVAKAVSMALAVSRNHGPEFCIRVANLRARWDPIFNHCYIGDLEAVRRMLVTGQASVLDVSATNGNGLLHTAMLKSQLDIVELLVQCGAEPQLENQNGESPYDMAWNSILSFQDTANSTLWKAEQLLKIFPNADACVGRRRLTQIHKIVMKMLHIDLTQQLILHPVLIDQADADGRSPLHWAAARGASEAVRVLLKHGASPNQLDFILQGPLRVSLKAESPDCMVQLLKAGAIVDQRDKWGQTCILAAMYYSQPEAFIPHLIEFGADINASDHAGYSPIYEAVQNNHAAATQILLRHNIDLDSVADNHGVSPLQAGIASNAHESVSVLLTHKFDHTKVNRNGLSVLHFAALFADLAMLRLLARARMRGLNHRLTNQQGKTAEDLAFHRIEQMRTETMEESLTRGYSAGDWETAFTELIFSVAVSTLRKNRSAISLMLGSEKSDSDDGNSFHSAIDYFAEYGIV